MTQKRRSFSAPQKAEVVRKQVDDIERFGAAHSNGVNTVFCDGSVHSISYGVDGEVWRAMGNRADMLQVNYPFE